MEEDFITFQLYHDRAVAQEIGDILQQANIVYKISENKKYFDPSFAFNKVDPEVNLKLKAADFIAARAAIEEHFRRRVNEVEANYYLFRFSNAELADVIRKPDEWGFLDQALAKKILADRGIPVPDSTQDDLATARMDELRRPEQVEPLWIGFGYLASMAGGFFGILIGWLIVNARKTLPNGERVHVYRQEDRKRGKWMMAVGIFVFAIVMLFRLMASATENISKVYFYPTHGF